ncbi:GNAT family N-acetyltransferase [Evansella tamaricis]|uniref:GNAT family N-acetyltransferase n=1 Tax=Evansella tamaricis TaxID=2069301 RepID=A0ABS6JBY2_9BACI|nr:GNAT family N-acetyltransferase [Evansella tamaricis]MBU9711192.1 GNAT family N-acetyltransferase [Evansella tamaricis]
MKRIKLDKQYKDEVVKVWKEAFQDDEEFDSEFSQYFFNQDDLWNYAYGWLDGNQLVSTYLSLNVSVTIRNKEFTGHYIDGLATLPSYQGRGLIHQQMLNDAKRCKEDRIPIMLVDPSRDSFYRKFGFEFACDQYRIDIDRLFCSDEIEQCDYTVKTGVIADNTELQEAYKVVNDYLFTHSPYNELRWPPCYEDIKYKRKDIKLTVAFDKEKQPCGFVLYSVDGSNMLVTSFRYTTLAAFFALKQFMLDMDDSISQFVFTSIPEDFPLSLFLKDLGRPEKKLYFGSWMSRMIRIVDFPFLLEKLVSEPPKHAISFSIKDKVLKENNNNYTLFPNGKVIIDSDRQSEVTSTMTDIVPLLTGLKSAKELYFQGKLIVNQAETLEQWPKVPQVIREIDLLFPKLTTFSADDYLAP